MDIKRIAIYFKAALATFGIQKLPEPNYLFKNGELDYDNYSHDEKKLFWASHTKAVSNETIKKGLLSSDIFMQINCISYLEATGITPKLSDTDKDYLLFNNKPGSTTVRADFIALKTTSLSDAQINRLLKDSEFKVRWALSKRNINFTEAQLLIGSKDEMSFISSAYKAKHQEYKANQEEIRLTSFLTSTSRVSKAAP